jgi:hypothetical protein
MVEIFVISLARKVVGVEITKVFQLVEALALVALSIAGEPLRDACPTSAGRALRLR